MLRLVPDHWQNPAVVEAESRSRDAIRGRTSTTHPCWPSNCWIGTTVEHQAAADERIPVIIEIPAPVRFLSVEPMLGPVDLSAWLYLEWMDALRPPGEPESFRGEGGWGCEMFATLQGRRPQIEWVIVGGESGGKRREMDPAWARDVIDQCRAAEVPVFFKQVSGLRPGGQHPELSAWKEFPRG